MLKLISSLVFVFFSLLLLGQDDSSDEINSKLYIESAFSFSHFEQQVKSEIGGPKGELLVDETTLSFFRCICL